MFLVMGLSEFLGGALRNMFPESIMLAIFAIIIVIMLCYFAQLPMTVTIMVSLITFAAIAGFSNSLLGISVNGLNSFFMPFLVLIFIIIGAVIAYALWRIFRA